MKRIIALCVLLSGCVFASFAQNNLQPLATVKINKSESITLGQLKSRVEVYQRQAGGINFTLEQKKDVLDAMIDEKLIVQQATKSGIAITDTQLNQYFLDTLASMVGRQVTESEFAEIIKAEMGKTFDQFMKEQVGMTVAEYKAFLKSQLLAQQYILGLKEKELKAITASDSEVTQYYEINKSSFVQSDMMKMFLVIVPKTGDPSGAKVRATSLYNDLKNKKQTTDDLKKQMANNSSVFQAGEMYVSKTAVAAAQLGINYDALLEMFKKSKNYMSEINESDVDYQFYIVLDKYDAKMLSLNDWVQPGTQVTVSTYIRENLIQQKQSELFQTALNDTAKSLRTSSNFKMEKKDSQLDKLLTW